MKRGQRPDEPEYEHVIQICKGLSRPGALAYDPDLDGDKNSL